MFFFWDKKGSPKKEMHIGETASSDQGWNEEEFD